VAQHSGDQRKVEILHSIVRSFIETGEPVASRSVSKQRGHALSAATVRNVMMDLHEEGYLAQPHTSAGRIPTQKAFVSYVQTLTPRKATISELNHVRNELNQAPTLEGRIERSSHLLTQLTQGMAIAAAIPASPQTLDHIELAALGGSRVLMVVVTRDQMVRNRVVMLDQPVSQDELNSIRNYVNVEFGGWQIHAVKVELERRLNEERATFDEILQRLTVLYSSGLLDVGMSPEVHAGGASNLVGIDLHLTGEKMRELFRTLEEKKRLLMLLERFLEGPSGELAVRVGLSEEHPAMAQLSLIGMTVVLPSGFAAKIAVLGPMRMNYERVMAAVNQVGTAFISS
jgi:heat-inducible transcriptional repressor